MGMIGTIGNIALIRDNYNFAIKNVALIKNIELIFHLYLFQVLQSNSTLKQLNENLDGGTQKFISLNKLRNLFIPLPDDSEQHKISHLLDRLDFLITLHQRKLK